MAYTAIITSHQNEVLSGVAKFNQRLADAMNIPCLWWVSVPFTTGAKYLISVKLKDSADADVLAYSRLINMLQSHGVDYDLFLHTFSNSDVEKKALERAGAVYCGNSEIRAGVRACGADGLLLYCPDLLATDVLETADDMNIFSFGMAHKLQTGYYRMLQNALVESNVDYRIWLSTAFHEKARFGDFEAVCGELRQCFGARIQFLGFLSDSGVNEFLSRSCLFVAFFESGFRANNTSLWAAMKRGVAVLTNLDSYSPDWVRHGENVLDIRHLRVGDLSGARRTCIAEKGRRDCEQHITWQGLLDVIARRPAITKLNA